jgi:hypothetical protein
VRNTRTVEIHSEAYSARIEAIDALRAAGPNGQDGGARLSAASDKLKLIAEVYGEAPNAVIYGPFAELMKISSLVVQWRQSVLNATPDAQRFLTAAKERSAAWLSQHAGMPALAGLRSAAEGLWNVQATAEVASALAGLAAVPLPIGLIARPKSESRVRQEAEEKPRPPELTVAFLKFTIDGRPLADTHYVSPGEAHDLDIEVRVSRWPNGATELMLEPVTIEQAGSYQLPVFSIAAPIGPGPFRFTQQGRAMLTVPQHLNARPYEFKYRAKFLPASSEQPVEVAGQRTLLLEGVDLGRHALTGYRNLDEKLIAIRDRLRRSGVAQDDLRNAILLASALANLAGQSVQDNAFDEVISEATFQKRVREFLRSHTSIGVELEEHPRAAGGITDLSFRGIRLELKSEADKPLVIGDCNQFVGQTASYAVGTGRRLAVLCVLDCSKKKQPAFPAEDGIEILANEQNGTSVYVVTVLIQGNLARPSSFSR